MAQRPKTYSAIIVHNISETMVNNGIKSSYSFVISASGNYYKKGNEIIPEEIMDKLYPTVLKRVSVKGDMIGKGNL